MNKIDLYNVIFKALFYSRGTGMSDEAIAEKICNSIFDSIPRSGIMHKILPFLKSRLFKDIK